MRGCACAAFPGRATVDRRTRASARRPGGGHALKPCDESVQPLVASAIDDPGLARAVSRRGLRLVPVSTIATPCREDCGALFGWRGADGDPARHIAMLRENGWTGPLLLVMGEGGSEAVARALDGGADDAVAASASPGEMAARIAARMRMWRDRVAAYGPLAIDRVTRRVSCAGRPVPLRPREYALLLHLVERAGQCVSRAELLTAVWGLGFDPGTNVVEVHVSRLRAAIRGACGHPGGGNGGGGGRALALVNERGRGYRLDMRAGGG